MNRPAPRGAVPAALTALAGLVAALTLLLAEPTAPAGTGPGPARGAAAGTAARATAPQAPPDRLTVPGRLDAAVVPVAADRAGALRLPAAEDELGWWSLGAQPGAATGTVLIAGHVDTADGRPGAFAVLRDLPAGATVEVTAADGTRHAYLVTGHRTYRQAGLPGDLFTASGPARLALVTCAGRYDREAGRYPENLVIYARPADRT